MRHENLSRQIALGQSVTRRRYQLYHCRLMLWQLQTAASCTWLVGGACSWKVNTRTLFFYPHLSFISQSVVVMQQPHLLLFLDFDWSHLLHTSDADFINLPLIFRETKNMHVKLRGDGPLLKAVWHLQLTTSLRQRKQTNNTFDKKCSQRNTELSLHNVSRTDDN